MRACLEARGGRTEPTGTKTPSLAPPGTRVTNQKPRRDRPFEAHFPIVSGRPENYIRGMLPARIRYRIRKADTADLPLLDRWRNATHVACWWGHASVDPDADKLRDPRIAMWIAEFDSRPIAFLQDYRIADWAPHHFDDLPPGSRGLDLYVGEADLLGRGHGAAVLDLHAANLFASGAPALGIDPHPDNLRARRAFEKAGFREVGGPVTTRWGDAILMHRFSDQVLFGTSPC